MDPLDEVQGGEDTPSHPEGAGVRDADSRENVPFPDDAVVDDGQAALSPLRPGTEAAAGGDDEPAGDGRGPDEEPSREAASPSGEDEEEPSYNIDPEDPETWPEDTRRAVGQYASRLDLANALIANRRSFKTELDRRVAEVKAGREQPAEPRREERPGETRQPAPVVLPEEARELQREMDLLSNAFNEGLPTHESLKAELPQLLYNTNKLRNAVEYLDGEIAAETDEADKDRLMTKRENVSRKLDVAESLYERKASQFERITDRLTRMQDQYKGRKAQVEEHTALARRSEERRVQDTQAEEGRIQGHETKIVAEIQRVLNEFRIPEAKRERFSRKLVNAATYQMDTTGEDIEDLGGFFAQEAREELKDWGVARQEQQVTLGSQKRRDASVAAPRGMAKPTPGGNGPRNRREADLLAARSARRIQYQG